VAPSSSAPIPDGQTRLPDRLQVRGWRITPQRRAVIGALDGDHVHVSAEEVHAAARRAVPEISLATVYNTLNELADMGEISQIRLGDGTTRYDPKIGPGHHHLICEGCGLTFDVEPKGVSEVTLPRAERYGMTIDTLEMVFRGRCSNCAERG
jgi:Fur family transcriptional regulator, stress-responsive regulator